MVGFSYRSLWGHGLVIICYQCTFIRNWPFFRYSLFTLPVTQHPCFGEKGCCYSKYIFSWGVIRRQRLQPPLEQPPRAPGLYVNGLAHRVNAPLLLILSFLVYMKRNTSQYWCFSFVFMTFTPTKTSRSQQDELFAKSDFHESIRLTAEVLYLLEVIYLFRKKRRLLI